MEKGSLKKSRSQFIMKTKKNYADFDPNGLSVHQGVFGLPFTEKDANIIVFPVPWDVTSSYSAGSSSGPEAILNASRQVDLYDPFVENAWKTGVFMKPVSSLWQKRSAVFRVKAEKYIAELEKGKKSPLNSTLQKINERCGDVKSWVKQETSDLLKQDKLVVVLGGDHSTPLGYIEALAEKHNAFTVLQIDAHADLRENYEGFDQSHASIMHNVLENCPNVSLTQVGIRDFCEAEKNKMDTDSRITTFYDRDLKGAQFSGKTWKESVAEIVQTLEDKVYVSFDVDGLDPKLCPNTGTPVPGGLEFEEVLFLLEQIVTSGKTIIGADLCEVSPGSDEWDANVGARLLFRLCNLLGKSNDFI